MNQKTFTYTLGDTKFQGFLATPSLEKDSKLPAVIIAPAFRGLDDFAKEKALQLASMGYVAFAADLYGEGVTAQDDDTASQLMAPLFCDRGRLRSHIGAAFETVKDLEFVKPDQISAIGFCFGGLAVLELMRSGKKLNAAVTFHALFGSTLGALTATLLPSRPNSATKLLMLHGYHDPLVSSQDLVQIQKEMTDHGIDWQLFIFGNATHAFTNPLADNEQKGMKYQPLVAKRAWLAMTNFLKEVFNS